MKSIFKIFENPIRSVKDEIIRIRIEFWDDLKNFANNFIHLISVEKSSFFFYIFLL